MRFAPYKNLFIFAALAVLAVGSMIVLSILWQSAPEPSPSVTSVKEEYLHCITLPEDEDVAQCLDEVASIAYNRYPTRDIAAVLDSLSYQEKNRWCHEIMHYMGWEAYAQEDSIADAFLHSSELCDSGMYHGVMEAYLRSEGLAGDIETLIRTVCTDALASHPGLSEGVLALCFHGLGHGLMYVTASDLGRSLEYCEILQEGAPACYGGVFMEFTTSKEIGPLHNNRNLTENFCVTLNEKYWNMCYYRMGLNFFSATNGSVGEAMELCSTVPKEHQGNCFLGVGGNNPSPSKSHSDAGAACLEALRVSEDAYEGCISGSLGFVLSLEWGDMRGAVEFCSAVDEQYQRFCYAEAGRAALAWVKPEETLAEKCSVLPAFEAEAACMEQ